MAGKILHAEFKSNEVDKAVSKWDVMTRRKENIDQKRAEWLIYRLPTSPIYHHMIVQSSTVGSRRRKGEEAKKNLPLCSACLHIRATFRSFEILLCVLFSLLYRNNILYETLQCSVMCAFPRLTHPHRLLCWFVSVKCECILFFFVRCH